MIITMQNFIDAIAPFDESVEWGIFVETMDIRNFFMLQDMYEGEEQVGFGSGATKYCIIDYENGIVFKIPRGVKTSQNITYCEQEYRNWIEISTNYPKEISDAFMPVYFLGNYECEVEGITYSFPVYAQEMVEIDEDAVYNGSFKNYSEWYRNENNCGNISDEDIEDEWSTYDIIDQTMMNFSDAVIYTVDRLHINDIHSENVGYYNGELKIFDYAGYGL